MLSERTRASLDDVAPDRALELECLDHGGDGRVVALAFGLEGARDARRAAVHTVDGRRESILNRFVDEKDALLLGAAGPLVHRAREEIGFHVGEIDVDHAEGLRPVNERQDTTLARRATER